MAREAAAKRREGNEIEFSRIASIFLISIPVAFLAPSIAPYVWLILFLDPSARLAGRPRATA
jgi:hypothetical protein